MQIVSAFTTPSDEAFALLLLENYWDQWSTMDLAEYRNQRAFDAAANKVTRRATIHGKWTKGALGATRYGGWEEAGMERFNQLYDFVVADRLEQEGAEREYLHLSRYRDSEGKRKPKQTIVHERTVRARGENLDDWT